MNNIKQLLNEAVEYDVKNYADLGRCHQLRPRRMSGGG